MQTFKRTKRFELFRTPRFLRRFRRNTQAVFSRGNSVTLFRDGTDLFPALFQALSAATSQILIEFYIIHNDHTGTLFADTLIEAAERGIQVYLTYDYIGCIDTPGHYFRRLEHAGIQCLPFNRPTFKKGLAWFDRRNHRKFVVIDDTIAFLGGINIGDEYSGYSRTDRWRDMGIRLEGPAVAELVRLFFETWGNEGGAIPEELARKQATVPEQGSADVMIVSGGPHHNRSFIDSSFRMAIAGSSRNIKIMTPYFVPGPRIVRSLLRAAKRGVAVQLLLPAVSDVPIVKLASRAYLAPLLKSGIEIYEREGTMLHAKVMLIDNCWATVGSANLDLRSLHRNYEINVIIDCPDFARQLDKMLADDLEKSRPISLSEHEARSWFEKLLERLCDPIRRFL